MFDSYPSATDPGQSDLEAPSPELRTVLSKTEPVRRLLAAGEMGNYFVAYTDGGCAPTDFSVPTGEGRWGVLLIAPRGESWEHSGTIPSTTSNRAEVCALLAAVACAPDGATLGVQSDSRYLVDHVRRGCQANDNDDLWREVREMLLGKALTLTSSWLPGHAGHEHNERADALCNLRGRRIFQTSHRPR